MPLRFIHTADIHLGNNQYQNNERYNDFGRAFFHVIDAAIQAQVAFVAIAGDLFHKRAIDALTLYQAQSGLRRLHDANIPVLIIEGNHDRAYYRDANVSWLSFLAWTGDAVLLAPTVDEGRFTFAPWSTETRAGGYYDLPESGIRVYGVPWYGASTSAVIEKVALQLRELRPQEEAQGIHYRVIMLHTGVEGMVPNVHGLPARQAFEPLHGLVDYIALGHVHMPYASDDWIYNPGSLETVSAEEWEWPGRGYYLVEPHPGAPVSQHAELISTPRRPFIRERFRVDGISTPDDLATRFDSFCARHLATAAAEVGREPVVDIACVGTLAFDPGAFDKHALEDIARRHVQPLLVMIRNFTQSLEFDPATGELDGRDRSTWHDLEQIVFRDLLRRDSRFETDAESWAQAIAELKQHALLGDDPAVIAGWLAQVRERIARGEILRPPD